MAGNDRTSERRKSDRPKSPVAVALSYERDEDQAPRVVATGRNLIAEQILQIAFANGVKVREDAELAQLLSLLDVDSEIPLEAFAAVAEILAYVYRANRMVADFGPEAFSPRTAEVPR
ncbi:MAG: EscU/YscU/HrcU family type III secretion system export apparatus switch protein [Rhodospirillales bacterium]